MAEPHDHPGLKLGLSEHPTPRSEPGSAPLASTIVAFGLTIVAWLLTLPAVVLLIYAKVNPDWDGSWDLVMRACSGAFLVGVPSLVLALLSRHRERRRGSIPGRRLAGIAVPAASSGRAPGR
jgi:RsiW-degrading membrane proteinase PrsW (M82 family)